MEPCTGDLGSPASLSVYFTYRHTIFQRGLAQATPPLLHKERLKISGYAKSGIELLDGE